MRDEVAVVCYMDCGFISLDGGQHAELRVLSEFLRRLIYCPQTSHTERRDRLFRHFAKRIFDLFTEHLCKHHHFDKKTEAL